MDEKKIDDAWKNKVEKEKGAPENIEEDQIQMPDPDFNFFISSLAIQAAIGMGQIENPVTNKKEVNLKQSKLIIDTLTMLREKTRGNLNAEEDGLFENMLYELRLQYVAVAKGQ